METYSFSGEDNQRFWTGNKASYEGEKNSEVLIFLSKAYIGTKLLDAGAGDGSLVRQLKKAFPDAQVEGVDIAPKSDDVEQGDIANLAYRDGSFDTIFCVEVIEHLTEKDTSKVLTGLNRIVSPGGMVIITTPYAENLEESTVTCPKCNIRFHRWGHQQSFQEKDFERLSKENGFEPVAIFPVKYSRVRRLRILGARYFMTRRWVRSMHKARGKRHLIMIARKP